MKPKVLLVMPTRDRPDVDSWQSALTAAEHYGSAISIEPGQPRDWNRNRCVRGFLKHEAHFEYMLFVDDDTIIPEDCISRLLAVDKPIVSGLQPLWMQGAMFGNVRLLDDPAKGACPWPDWVRWDIPKEPFQIGCCGFGCILLRRDAFEIIRDPWFVETYPDANNEGMKTEDVDFCEKAVARGVEMWCEPTVICGHRKKVDLIAWIPRTQVNLSVKPLRIGE